MRQVAPKKGRLLILCFWGANVFFKSNCRAGFLALVLEALSIRRICFLVGGGGSRVITGLAAFLAGPFR